MVKIEELLKFYPVELANQKRNIYAEYLQYLIVKKIFDYNFGFDIYLAGNFYNRLKFNLNRFSNSIDLVSESVQRGVREQINAYIKKSLELEGYHIEIRNYRGQYKIVVQAQNFLSADDASENQTEFPITLLLNYFNSENYFMGNTQGSTASLNICKFNVCTRINTINHIEALTFLVRKIIKTRQLNSVDIYDLIYFKKIHDRINKNYFSTADQRNLLDKLYEACQKIRRVQLVRELSMLTIDHNFENYLGNKSWVKSFIL